MSIRRFLTVTVCALCLLPALAAGDGGARDSQSNLENFVLALEAYRENDWQRAELLHQQLAHHSPDYPLMGYLTFHQLREDLPDVDASRIQAFLRQHADSPLAEDMRHTAMRAYGARADWRALQAISQGVPGNLALRCYYYRAMLDQERERALDAARDLYLSGSSRPDTCDPLFAALEQAGQLNDELIWQRMQLAYKSNGPGMMRYLRSELSSQAYLDKAAQLLNLYQRPADVRLLNAGALPDGTLVAIMERLARKDPNRAWQLLPVLAARFGFTDEQRYRIARRAAWHAVIGQGPSHFSWLDPWLENNADEDLLEQRTRAAVRAQNWDQVLTWTAQMSASQQQEANWQYWRGRALQETNNDEAGIPLLQSAATQRSFWGFLAAEALGQPFSLNQAQPAPSAAELSDNEQRVVERVRLLLQGEQASLARNEWLKLIRRSDKATQSALAELAHQQGWSHLSVETALFSRQYDRLDWRFPVHMAAQFERASRASGVDPLLLMSVARRESAFNPHARSPVGARGLMQLMPATARAVARDLGTPAPDSAALLDKDLNLKLGSQYMAELLQRYGGNRVLSLAAYNAGPHRVDRWLRNGPTPFDVFIESIPFRETREYVQAVLAYRVIFGLALERPTIALMEQSESGSLYGPVMLASFSGTGSCGTC